MELLSIFIALLSLIVIIVVCAVLYFQNEKIREEQRFVMRDIVDQVNNANMYAYGFDKKQEENIRNLDNNIQNVDERVKSIYPGDKLCLGATCLNEDELRTFKQQFGSTTSV